MKIFEKDDIDIKLEYMSKIYLIHKIKIWSHSEQQPFYLLLFLLVIIIKKLNDEYFEAKDGYLHKEEDAINPLYSFLMVYCLLL